MRASKAFFTTMVIWACVFSISIPQGHADGKFQIKPMVTVASRLETNFFNTEEDKQEVYTFLIQPGIMLGYETPKTKATLHYTLEAYKYKEKGGRPEGAPRISDLDYLGHLAALELRYRPARRITFGLDNSYYHTRYPTVYDRLSDSIEMDRYSINRITPIIFYEFERRFQAGLRYRRTDIWYKELKINDSVEHRFIGNIIYDPVRTLTLDLELNHWWLDYKYLARDYRSNQIKLSAQKRYKYFAFDAGVGYHRRSHKNPAIPDGSTFAYKVSVLVQNPPPPEGLRYLGGRFVRSRTHGYLGFERNFSNYADDYIAHRLTGDMGHVFYGKIQARLRGYYQTSKYRTQRGLSRAGVQELRNDKTRYISGSLAYLFSERMDVTLTGGQKSRRSNIAGRSYRNEFVMLTFNFNFDLQSRGGYTEEGIYY